MKRALIMFICDCRSELLRTFSSFMHWKPKTTVRYHLLCHRGYAHDAKVTKELLVNAVDMPSNCVTVLKHLWFLKKVQKSVN